MGVKKKIVLVICLLLSVFTAFSQTGFIKPSFPAEEYSSSRFRLYKRPYLELKTLHSLSVGVGMFGVFEKWNALDLSLHYDFIHKAAVGNAGFFRVMNFRILKSKMRPVIGLYYANLRELNNEISYMPFQAGLITKKASLCYVRNFFLAKDNAFEYPVNQITFKYYFSLKKRRKYIAD